MQHHEPPAKAALASDNNLLPNPILPLNIKEEIDGKPVQEDPASQGLWQRNSNLTPEAWQQQVDQKLQKKEVEQQAEECTNQRASRQNLQHSDPVFKESKSKRCQLNTFSKRKQMNKSRWLIVLKFHVFFQQ